MASVRKIVIKQVCCNSVSGEPGGGGELELSLQEVEVIDEGLKARRPGGSQESARRRSGVGQELARRLGVGLEAMSQSGGQEAARWPGCGREAIEEATGEQEFRSQTGGQLAGKQSGGGQGLRRPGGVARGLGGGQRFQEVARGRPRGSQELSRSAGG